MISKYDKYWETMLPKIKNLIEEAFQTGYSGEIDVSDIRRYGNRKYWGTRVTIPYRIKKITEQFSPDAHGKSLGNVIIHSGIIKNYKKTLFAKISKKEEQLYLHFEILKTEKPIILNSIKVPEKKDIISVIGKLSRKVEKNIIYVGDTHDVLKRIRTNHCRGNVEASAFRRHVAKAKGYKLKSSRRKSGSTKIRIDIPNPRIGEKDVSDYIRSGMWRCVICDSYAEAHDFQWYVIDLLNPLLNKERKPWNRRNEQRYQELFDKLTNSPRLKCNHLSGVQSGPGVYVFNHHQSPE